MFIKDLHIENFRCFKNPKIPTFKQPDGKAGGGLNVFAGENGTGKTAVLDAISLLTQSRLKTQNELSIEDFNSSNKNITIHGRSWYDFDVKRAIPGNHKFKSSGFEFYAHIRRVNSKKIVQPFIFDNKYIKSTSETITLLDPELRQDVQNPYGLRFTDLQTVYIDQNRTRHTKSGKFAPSKFDDLISDFNFQFLQSLEALKGQQRRGYLNVNKKLNKLYSKLIVDKILLEPISAFKKLTGNSATLDFINVNMPYLNSFFTVSSSKGKVQIPLEKLGSGIEMIFSMLFLYSFYKSRGINTIWLIDEPELHLHPKLQNDFVSLILEISKNSQVFIATHSPYLLKPIIENGNATLFIFTKLKSDIKIRNPKIYKRKLFPWSPSWGEVNFFAYNMPTIEFHNELYGYLQVKKKKYTEASLENYLISKHIPNSKSWIPEKFGIPQTPSDLTICTYIRNFIHHPENTRNTIYTPEELKSSVEIMQGLLRR